MSTETLTSVVIGALLMVAASAYAEESPIQVAMQDGKTQAQFRVGDSRCALVDATIRCSTIAK
jgi:hypothetical protein